MSTFERSTIVTARTDEVWARIITPEGINDEMLPWMTMRLPSKTRALTVETVPINEVLGRAWILLFGVLPIDYDRLSIIELDPGRHFHEKSTMASMRRWEHERTLTPIDDTTTRVTDRITLEPRIGSLSPLLTKLLHAFFGHRHRRLHRHFAPKTTATSPDTPTALDSSEEAQRTAYLRGHRRNPFTTSPRGGRALSAAQQSWFTLRPPKGYGVLTTIGRKTGEPRRKCVRAVADGDKVYLVSLRGPHAAWMHNIRANPEVQLRIRGGTFAGLAREIRDPTERRHAHDLVCGTINAFDRLEYRMHRTGRPNADRIRALHEHFFAVGTPVVIEIARTQV